MHYYRLYFIHPLSGHIEGFQEFEAGDDEGALVIAGQHQAGHPLELWCGKRKVRRIEAESMIPVSRQNAE